MTKPGKHRILVVDDELTVCKSIRQVLVREDCEVDMALSGEEALRKEAERPYDVIIVDLMMPGISGLDLLKMLKARNPKARIIMVTGYPTMKNTLQAMQLGAWARSTPSASSSASASRLNWGTVTDAGSAGERAKVRWSNVMQR